jgi:hypothetical protein
MSRSQRPLSVDVNPAKHGSRVRRRVSEIEQRIIGLLNGLPYAVSWLRS